MSNWKEYSCNGWFTIKGRSSDEATRKARERIKYELGSTEDINVAKLLKGAWKLFDFKGWFQIKGRSEEEALKRGAILVNKRDLVLVDDNGVQVVGPDVKSEPALKDQVGLYLTDQVEGPKVAYHFQMRNADNSVSHEIHAASAKDAWNSMRNQFMYDEQVILAQHVQISTAISPRWRVFDSQRDTKTPTHLGHQIVIAVGYAGEHWWPRTDNVLRVDENANLIEVPELPLNF